MTDRIFGYKWEDIQRAQQGGKLPANHKLTAPGRDYGCDPLGDGVYRMVPSGDIVDYPECNRRLGNPEDLAVPLHNVQGVGYLPKLEHDDEH